MISDSYFSVSDNYIAPSAKHMTPIVPAQHKVCHIRLQMRYMTLLMQHKNGYGKAEHKINKKLSKNRVPLHLLKEEVLDGYCINIDETVLQVLNEPGRDARTKSYMWIFKRGDPLRPVMVYEYHPRAEAGT